MRPSLARILDSRLFALGDFCCTLLACSLWLLGVGPGWLPLLIGLLPWLVRLAGGRFPFRRTPFDLALLVFLLSAGVAVWAAYDRPTAVAKFWLLAAAVLLYYSLAAQPAGNLVLAFAAFGALGVTFAAAFLLTADWSLVPAKVAWLQQLGLRWMAVRPQLQAPPLHPNDAADVLIQTLPLVIALAALALHRRRLLSFTFLLLCALLCCLVLVLTTSRGAWVAGLAALGLWGMWLLAGPAARRQDRRRGALFALLLLGSALAAAALIALRPQIVLQAVAQLPGPSSAGSRLGLFSQARFLAADFSFTGGGLGAFPGLYSQYMLGIPFLYLKYSHNILLDMALEQGLAGCLAALAVFVGSLALLFSSRGVPGLAQPDWAWMRWAVFTSLAAMLVHGMVDNFSYNSLGAPLLFFSAGIAQSLAPGGWTGTAAGAQGPSRLSRLALGLLAFGGLALLAGLALRSQARLLAAFYADLGALRMAQVELRGFPGGEWLDERQALAQYAPARWLLERALALDPANRTANQRLGLLAMKAQDFPQAVRYLEAASRQAPDHRGVRKALGYAYAWAGLQAQAAQALAGLSEARQELQAYSTWWAAQGRPDLAQRAAHLAASLPGIPHPASTQVYQP